MRPDELDALPERHEVRSLLLRAVSLGALIGVIGCVLGLSLREAEQGAWSHVTETYYPSLLKLLMLPAMYGWMMAFSGLFRSLRVVWPWLETPSVGARFTRAGAALVLLGTTGLMGCVLMWMAVEAVSRAFART